MIVKNNKNLMALIFSYSIERHQVNTHFKLISSSQAVQACSEDPCLNQIPRRKVKLEIAERKDLNEYSKRITRIQLYSVDLNINSSCLVEFLKLWRTSMESRSRQSGVRNLILKCNDSTATDYLQKCFAIVNTNNACLRYLETLNFYPSENNHLS